MNNAFEIIRTVFDAFKSLPVKLAAMNGKSEEWYRSHARESKTLNPASSGNVSPVDHYMQYCRKFDGGIRGAGRALSSRVYAALEDEFAENDRLDIDHVEMEVGVIDETADVQKWLARFDIKHASKLELLAFENHCNEAIERISEARGQARVQAKIIDIKREDESNVHKFGRAG